MLTATQAREVFLKTEREAERLLGLAVQCETEEAFAQIMHREEKVRELAAQALNTCRLIAAESAAWN